MMFENFPPTSSHHRTPQPEMVSVMAKNELNIRKGPGRSWPSMGVILEGDQVTCFPETARADEYNQDESWIYCESQGRVGWLLRSSFEFEPLEAPTSQPRPAAGFLVSDHSPKQTNERPF